MVAKLKWNLRRELDQLKSWLSPENASLLRDQPRLELADLLSQRGPNTFGLIAVCLDNISLWESQAGACDVLEGEQSGWSKLRLALEHSAWHLRIKYALYIRAHREGRTPSFASRHGFAVRCLAQAITLQDDGLADWCGERLLQRANYQNAFFRDWDDSPLYPFMARVFATWRNCDPDNENERFSKLGIYQSLLDNWNNTEQYAAALVLACDYHCIRRFCAADEDTEFWRSPFQVFPAEILAVQRVRKELLGGIPEIRHPLLDNPLARPPSSISLSHDELLARVITRVNSELLNG